MKSFLSSGRLLCGNIAFSVALALLSPIVHGAVSIVSVLSPVPTGPQYTYVNFDNLALGTAGGISNGIQVSVVGGAQIVQGSVGGVTAAPFIANSSGLLFGDPTVSGLDSTPYLTTSGLAGSVTLKLPGEEQTFGLLWSSVDASNVLTFFDSNNVAIGSFSGGSIVAAANGDPGAGNARTYYATFSSTSPFSRVVASGAFFEFDNVLYAPVPEPSPYISIFIGLAVISISLVWRPMSLGVLKSGSIRNRVAI